MRLYAPNIQILLDTFDRELIKLSREEWERILTSRHFRMFSSYLEIPQSDLQYMGYKLRSEFDIDIRFRSETYGELVTHHSEVKDILEGIKQCQ